MVVEVIVNSKAKQLNKTFDYIVPKNMEDKIKIGSRVFVPFGRIKKQESFVVNIKKYSEFANKEILEIEDTILPAEKIELAKLMARKYFCNVSDCVKLMLPPGNATTKLNNRTKEKMANYAFLKKSIKEIDDDIKNGTLKSVKQIRLLEFLKENDGIYIVDLETLTDTTRAVTKGLEKNGYIEIIEKQIERNPFINKQVKSDCKLELNQEQQCCFNKIEEHIEQENYSEFLLYGVTGSRKNRSISTINRKSTKKG